jgi:hypothetical protein
MSYDPNVVDAYAEHLGEVNKDQAVVVTEDIRNANGVLIARKGQRVSTETVSRIVQFKLLKPIEESVDLADPLTAPRLVAAIRALLVDDTSKKIFERFAISTELERCTASFCRYGLLRQKLTVLASQMPEEYEKALTVAWQGLAIGFTLGLSAEQREHLFVAALSHDLGMLHINRELVAKQGVMTADEWRTVQSHAVIGYLMIEQGQMAPKPIAQAVLEHHETFDGTGYISGKHGAELGVLGQIVGVVDAMAVVTRKLRTQNRGLRDLLPILRIDRYVHRSDVCDAFIQILLDEGLGVGTIVDDDVAQCIGKITSQRDLLKDYLGRLQGLIEQLPETKERNKVSAARNLFGYLTEVVHGSGVLETGYDGWLLAVGAERQRGEYREVEDTYLMLREVEFQLSRLTRVLHEIIEDRRLLTVATREKLQHDLAAMPGLENMETSASGVWRTGAVAFLRSSAA